MKLYQKGKVFPNRTEIELKFSEYIQAGTVYIKVVPESDLDLFEDYADDGITLYGVYDQEGNAIAGADSLEILFAAAKQHDAIPVFAH